LRASVKVMRATIAILLTSLASFVYTLVS